MSDHTYITGYSDSTLLVNTVNYTGFSDNDFADGYQSLGDWANKAAWYRNLLNTKLGSSLASGVQLMETEFNCDLSNKQAVSLVGGLWVADAIGGLMQTEFTVALQWDLTNGYTTLSADPSHYGWREGSNEGLISTGTNAPPAWGPYIPYPEYFAEQLLSKIMQSGGQVVSASSSDSNLSVYAVREQNGHVDLLVINKSASSDLTGTFNFTGFTPSTSATYWRYGKTEDTAQSQTSDGHASLSTGTATLAVNGSNYSYTFSSYSMTVLDLTPVNQAPTNITLSNASVAENQPLGTTVGTLGTTDPDSGNTFTYSLVSGTGSADNASFTIVGNTLKTAAVFDYETKTSYSIRVRTTDQGGLYYEKAFTIAITNVPETYTWDGGSTVDSNWSTAANWVGDLAPAAGDSLVFPAGAARLDNVNDYPAGTVFGSIDISGSGYKIVNGGNTTPTSITVESDVQLEADAIVTGTLTLGAGHYADHYRHSWRPIGQQRLDTSCRRHCAAHQN